MAPIESSFGMKMPLEKETRLVILISIKELLQQMKGVHISSMNIWAPRFKIWMNWLLPSTSVALTSDLG